MDAPHPFIDSGHDWSKVCFVCSSTVLSVQCASNPKLSVVQDTEATIDSALNAVESQLCSEKSVRYAE